MVLRRVFLQLWQWAFVAGRAEDTESYVDVCNGSPCMAQVLQVVIPMDPLEHGLTTTEYLCTLYNLAGTLTARQTIIYGGKDIWSACIAKLLAATTSHAVSPPTIGGLCFLLICSNLIPAWMVVYAAKRIMEYNSVDRRLSLHSSFIHFHKHILGYNILAAGTLSSM